MTTTYDRTALAGEALSNLFKDGGTGQSPEDEDILYVDSRIDAMLEDLSGRNVVSITDPDDIPPAYFLALGEILADVCAPKFNRPRNPAMRLDAEDRLKTVVNNTPAVNKTLKVDPALRRGATGLSLARWTRGA